VNSTKGAKPRRPWRAPRSLLVLLAPALLFIALRNPAVSAQEPPTDPSDFVNALLSGLLGFHDTTGPELQREVADVGGIPFRSEVPLDFMSRADLGRYVTQMLDEEYPAERAQSDQKTLVAFDLLDATIDLRPLRLKLLLENVAGFYDERPGKRRLYTVSEDRRLTPYNQLVLAHELRHALQDQYADIHALLPDAVGDFDDRRMALLSLLEGDATLVMERFLVRHLPGGQEAQKALSNLSVPTPPVAGAPPVLRDQLVLPYIAGREFANALFDKGGWAAIQAAWKLPPESTEQVLHPETYFSRKAPRSVELSYVPPKGRLINEGVLGEMLIRTLLGEETESEASSGWGGDHFRVWDLSGKTLLVWRSVWDSPRDLQRFRDAALGRFRRVHGEGTRRRIFTIFGGKNGRFALGELAGGMILVSCDDEQAFDRALLGMLPS